MKIFISGMAAGVPRQGGAAWAVMQYVLGLRRLGHHVTFVEPVDRIDDVADSFNAIVDYFGLADAALIERGSNRTLGASRASLLDGADLLLNISGTLCDDELCDRIDTRVFLDLDPAFTQLWFEADGIDPGFERHNRFVTIGTSIGDAGCEIPTCDREWITTAQPIVLEQWPFAEHLVHDAATTVGHWRGYGSIHHRGVHYGQKAHSMRDLLQLNSATDTEFLLALGIHPDETNDIAALDNHGWQRIDPNDVAGTPAEYFDFVQGSWAEFGVAKTGYVVAHCGWFSDRSLCYLASGRPVVAQETGFSEWLPTGEGLFAFTDVGEAAAALDEIRGDYPRHRLAARGIAEEFFDSDRVLQTLLDRL